MLFCALKIVLQKSSAYISGLGFPRENFIPSKNDYTGFPFSYQDYSVYLSWILTGGTILVVYIHYIHKIRLNYLNSN